MAWDGLTIGVSPELCEGMNLDFDGDELHFAVVSSPEAREELKLKMNSRKLDKFSQQNISHARKSSGEKVLSQDMDFMMSTSCCMDDLPKTRRDTLASWVFYMITHS
ncbi:hypothetical protein CCR75_003955 [Bremia lactucae]|uniref:Uncharacterized protein n=1 Tax=Bremia lactucae TaxID=4779 RepID=A0A976FM55_BRELC|nr:hypothetical protein CCR75_003955 [Bremia lactucae]